MNDVQLVVMGPAGTGRIWTGHRGRPRLDAIAVAGGCITAVDDDARALARSAAEVVDLGGAFAMPAFGDGHAHPLWGGVELAEAPVREAGSVAEVVATVRSFAAAHPGLAWVRGGSYDPTLAPDGVFDARWLDEAVPDRPAVLTSSDHHVMWCNTAALRAAGIDATTPDPPAGEIVRRPDGSPVGTLREWSALSLVERVVPPVPRAARVEGLLAAGRLLAAAGVGWVQDAKLDPDDVDTYLEAAASGELRVRANLALLAEPGGWHDRLEAFAAARAAAEAGPRDIAGAPVVRARTVKIFVDGVVEAGTAALLDPYDDAPASRGREVWDRAELSDAVVALDAAGWQVHLHAIGDAGVRVALDAVAAARDANGDRDRRPVLAHVQLVDPADLPRFAELGVIANVEPLWACLDDCQRELTLPRIGARRGEAQYPFASLARSGAALSTGSDWPVSSLRPLDYLSVACTRETPDGSPPGGWTPGERLSPRRALLAATSGVAFQAFEETRRGALLPGWRGDLVVLGQDLLETAPSDWPSVPVLGTWTAGTRCFEPAALEITA
jgi:predicted amidohydrolase YtcJ